MFRWHKVCQSVRSMGARGIKWVFLREWKGVREWVFCVGGLCEMADMWCVCVLGVTAGIQIKFPSLLEWSECVHECVRVKCVLHGAWQCVIKTQRGRCGKMHTGIKMGIGICAQKHSCSHSPTVCHTCNLAHILLLICHSAHSQTRGASCNIKKLLSYH